MTSRQWPIGRYMTTSESMFYMYVLLSASCTYYIYIHISTIKIRIIW